MLKVIGKESCDLCKKAKEKLTKLNIEFDYSLINEITQKEFNRYRELAIQADNINLPVIIYNGKSVTITQVIKSHG